MKTIRGGFCASLAATGIVLMLGTIARAGDVSPWIDDMNSALRLVGGGRTDDALRAGVEIKMQPGWHTYWRYPGDSGVPPRFDFSGSDNVADVKVFYPAPHAIIDQTGTTIGYTDNVIFPLRVVPREKDKPVTLRAKIDYAVCEKLCVPVEARAELPLAGSADNAALSAAEARVPKPISAAEADLNVRRVTGDTRKPLVVVELTAFQPVEIYVEGPTADWALPIPKPTQGAPAGRQQFGFELDGLPPGTDPKSSVDLIFTVISGGRASEVKTRLD
jgi:DsbC/DsbD-like thiol-disulfide interchange protein